MTYTPPSGTGNVVSGTGTSGTTLTVAKPGNLADGDVLVIVGLDQIAGATFTTPSGFTNVYTATATGTRGFAVFGKPITSASGEPSSYSISATASSARWVAVAFRLPGMASTWVDAVSSSDYYASVSTTSTSLPTVTPVSAHTLALAFQFANNPTTLFQTFTASGWTNLANATVTSGSATSIVDVSYKELTSTAALGTTTFSVSPASASVGGFQLTLGLPVSPTGTLGTSGSGALTLSGVPSFSGSLDTSSTGTLSEVGSVSGAKGRILRVGMTSPASYSGSLNLSGSGSLTLSGSALATDHKGRILRVGLTGTSGVPKGRILRVGLTGGASAPRGRLLRVGLTGGIAFTLNPIASQAGIEPGTTVSLTATVSNGSATGYTWRQISGPSITLSGTGASRSFTAPSYMDGTNTSKTAIVTLGVTATNGTTTTAEQTVTITCTPQTVWMWQDTFWGGQGGPVPLS